MPQPRALLSKEVNGFALAGMMNRQKVTIAKLLETIESEFTNSLGRSAGDYMSRVRIYARAGEPNWNAEIDGGVGISVLGPFLASLDRVKAVYNLGDDDREHLPSGR